MARYPNFLVAEYYDILHRIYGWSFEQIEKRTGISSKAVTRRSMQRYANDSHVLRMIMALDELGHFREKDLAIVDERSRAAFALQPPATALRLFYAELRNCETVLDYFSCAESRLRQIGASSRFWVEQTETTTRLCHQYFYEEEKFSGPQGTFVFLLQGLVVLGVDKRHVTVNFPHYGIRDEQGFFERTGCLPFRSGNYSFIEIDESVSRFVNGSYNVYSKLAVSEALDDLLAGEKASFLETVENLLRDNIELSNRSLDIEAVAKLMGISRITLHRRLKEEGQSFRDLRSKTRLSHAANLLRNTSLEISEISESLDYSEPSAFCRAFKLQNGCSPNEFRARSNSAGVSTPM